MPESEKQPRRAEFAKLLIAMFALPLPFEAAIAFAKREPYDPRRAGILLATIAVLLVFGLIMRQRSKDWHLQSIIGYYSILIGLILATAGLAAVFAEDNLSALIWPDGSATIVTALASSLGFLLIAAGFYLIGERRRRALAEVDIKPPKGIGTVRVFEKDQSVALWQDADQAGHTSRKQLIDIARNAMSVDDLHYIAMYNPAAECQFYVDLFDEDQVATMVEGSNTDRRETLVQLGTFMRFLTQRHEKQYPSLHTGALVRLVMDVEQGSTFYYSLSTKEFLIGATLNQQQVDPTDWKLSDLANEIRVKLGMTAAEDFYRLCPRCEQTNRPHPHHPPGQHGGNVHELRPRDVG